MNINKVASIDVDSILKELIDGGYSSAEVADALNKTGVIPLCMPVSNEINMPVIGRVRPIFAAHGSNFELHQYIEAIKHGEVVVIFTENCDGRALIGEIITEYIIKKRHAAGIVVHGLIRDSHSVKDNKYPVWAFGTTPIGCLNQSGLYFTEETKVALLENYSGGIAVCDNDGVVVIKKRYFDEIIASLKLIRDQETIWKYCINELGWSTDEVIFKKKYLYEDKISFPENLKESILRLKQKK